MIGILTLTRNNLKLTQRAIWSALRQDVPVTVRAIDNGSRDGSVDWLKAYGWLMDANPDNAGVSAGWNRGLGMFFDEGGYEAVCVIGNDTELAPWCVRALSAYDLPFVTGVAVDDHSQIEQRIVPKLPLQPYPDFSCFLIRRDVWKRVGPFDERMKLYASDCDFHIRAHRMGINLWKACAPFYHERSSTLRNATPEEAAEIQTQANKDRAVFQSIYNCLPGTPEYESIFAQSPTSQTDSSPVASGSSSEIHT